jgi:hypothetical protein
MVRRKVWVWVALVFVDVSGFFWPEDPLGKMMVICSFGPSHPGHGYLTIDIVYHRKSKKDIVPDLSN